MTDYSQAHKHQPGYNYHKGIVWLGDYGYWPHERNLTHKCDDRCPQYMTAVPILCTVCGNDDCDGTDPGIGACNGTITRIPFTRSTMTLPTINLRPTPWKFVRPDQGDDYFRRLLPDGTEVRFDIQSGRKKIVKASVGQAR